MMKVFLISIGVFISLFSRANDDVYLQKMQQSIEQLNRSSTIVHYQTSANAFERISRVESDKWQPMYYTAYSYVLMSFQISDGDEKDKVLDRAQEWIDTAQKVAPDESELYVLQAFLYPSRIMVDPVGRGMKYMGMANKALAQAKQLNPDNPRAYYLEATFIQNMPAAMGGGIEKAVPLYKLALEKFQHFVPDSVIDPNWGKQVTQEALRKANDEMAME
ncbi:hypothetical protein [Carboxylicivirga sp. N1Y90]|uniref:hypothetical protein n=1 Tax=Carboxylicivirga fragile TaxID=3417571 RepID=UPI003D32B62F|nr:hypothetical protein [Marinilabiliaceae bacterium N1Y90]